MKPAHRSLLLHPLFLIALILLFANDTWWKYTYPGWFTGKLSDVTGIFVFVVFLNTILPNRKWLIALFTILFFTWWKSPLSGPAINWLNDSLHLPACRTIDYTDLIALLVIPAALRLQPFQYNSITLNKLVKPLAFLFTLHAICATSMYRHPYMQPPNELYLYKTYTTKLTEDQVLHKLDSLNIAYTLDSVEMYPAYTNNYYLKVDHGKDSATEWVAVSEMENPKLYYRYVRTPYYEVATLELEKDTLKNIRFRISDRGRKRAIELLSVEVPGQFSYTYYLQPRVYKKYKKMLKSILVD